MWPSIQRHTHTHIAHYSKKASGLNGMGCLLYDVKQLLAACGCLSLYFSCSVLCYVMLCCVVCFGKLLKRLLFLMLCYFTNIIIICVFRWVLVFSRFCSAEREARTFLTISCIFLNMPDSICTIRVLHQIPYQRDSPVTYSVVLCRAPSR